MLKHAVISALRPLVSDRVYTVRHGLARGLKRRGGLGFVPRLSPESTEEAFLQRLDLAGETIYDVGGFEGIFALFFAQRVGPTGRVLTFEPNPRSAATIRENVRLNGFTNTTVHQLALGAVPGRARLVFPAGESARGSLERSIQSQIEQERDAETVEVEVDTIDEQLAQGAPRPTFVKLDVEGFERDILEGMGRLIAQAPPRLYIELHGADRVRKHDNARSVIECLWRARYHVHHVESGLDIERDEQIASAIEGHVYAVAPSLL
jgi:FkbM family methyltransferase